MLFIIEKFIYSISINSFLSEYVGGLSWITAQLEKQ